jgi:hypothetical protein
VEPIYQNQGQILIAQQQLDQQQLEQQQQQQLDPQLPQQQQQEVVPGQEPIYQNLPLHEKLNQSYTGEEEEEQEEIPIGEIFFLMPLISYLNDHNRYFLKSKFFPVYCSSSYR